MKARHALCFFYLLMAPLAFAFEFSDIISPTEGTWANMQPLVLDTSDGSELYYSLTGSDPLESGFAYDGPVLIDEAGSVSINITALDGEGRRKDFSVSYSVQPSSVVFSDPDESLFIQAISSNPIRKYVSGSFFSIPERFLWCIGKPIIPNKSGRRLSLSSQNNIDRYVSCSVTEGTSLWQFVIHIVPDSSLALKDEERTVPFELKDWETFVFTGEKLIYQIDDEFWTASKEALHLDRSVQHVVRWQSMDYEFGNPVETFVLPAKPELSYFTKTDGTSEFFINSENFTLGKARMPSSDCVTVGSGRFDSVSVDVFEDDSISGLLELGVYYNGVYQGDLSSAFYVDKKIPQPPVISSSEKQSYARSRVRLTITGEDDADIYYAVSSPVESDSGFSLDSEELFSSVRQGTFSLYRKGAEISLSSHSRKATYYKVSAYCLDRAGNKSPTTEYHVVVDEFNFYISPQGSTLNSGAVPDGSYSNPFTDFSEALAALKKSSYMTLHVMGDMVLPSGDTVIETSCVLTGNNVRITVPEDARILINSADFEAEGIVFERAAGNYSPKETTELFSVNGGSLTLRACEVVGTFQSNGILIDADDALVSLEDSGLTVQASSYAAVLSSSAVNATVLKCRLTSVGDVAVGLSLNAGTVLCDSSSCTLITRLGRCLELVNSVAHVTGSSFVAQREGSLKGTVAVWKDLDSLLYAEDNEESGF